ncbi:Multidrug resistance protein [Stygiomarasmius scandens]|uniref:Multidrug resistance protein n=1 Tax=Marasmiellus scandens TaxID=2682957 RepID=A0ABR1IQ78_9AGAR
MFASPITLSFATQARTTHTRLLSLWQCSVYENTKLEGDFIRGVSGVERKRVPIAEVASSARAFMIYSTRLQSCMKGIRSTLDIPRMQFFIEMNFVSRETDDFLTSLTALRTSRPMYSKSSNVCLQEIDEWDGQ